MSDSARMHRNFTYATIAAASAGFLFLLNAVAGQYLGDDFGKFSYALRLATIGEALMDLGINQITFRAFARDRTDAARLLQSSLALKMATAVVMFVVMGVVSFWLQPERDVRVVCLLMLGAAVLRSYILTARGVLIGLEHFGADCLIVVSDRLLLFAGGVAVLLHGGHLIDLGVAFVVVRIIAVTGALGIARRLVGPLALQFDLGAWRELQTTALPFGMFLVAQGFYSYIDTVMLGRLSTWDQTALYSAAFTIYEGLSYAPAILSSVLTPRLSRLWKDDRAEHRRLARAGIAGAIALAAVVALAMWWLAEPALTLAFGTGTSPDYATAAETLRILVAGLGFIFVTWLLQAVATSVFEERLLLRTTAIGAVFNIALNFYLIPRYGRNGAAFATLAAELLTVVLLLIGLWRVLAGPMASSAPDSATHR
jgi:O-antigen/teichoic acid export membrane protein